MSHCCSGSGFGKTMKQNSKTLRMKFPLFFLCNTSVKDNDNIGAHCDGYLHFLHICIITESNVNMASK